MVDAQGWRTPDKKMAAPEGAATSLSRLTEF